MTFFDTRTHKIQFNFYLKGLNLEYLYLLKSSRKFLRDFSLRLKSARDVTQGFELYRNIYFNAEEKLILALSMNNIQKILFNNNLVVFRKNFVSCRTSIFNLYLYCFLSLINVLLSPLLCVKTNRYSITSTEYLSGAFIDKLITDLLMYENACNNYFKLTLNSNFTRKTKRWFCSIIPFDSNCLEVYLNFYNLKFSSFSFVELSFLKADSFCNLLGYIVVDLVRINDVWI